MAKRHSNSGFGAIGAVAIVAIAGWFYLRYQYAHLFPAASTATAAPAVPVHSPQSTLPDHVDTALGEILNPDPVQGFQSPTTGMPAVNPIVNGYSGAFSSSSNEDQILAGLFPKSYAFGGSPLADAGGGSSFFADFYSMFFNHDVA